MFQSMRSIWACLLATFLLISSPQQGTDLPPGISTDQFSWLQELAKTRDRSQVLKLVEERPEWRTLASFEATCKAFDTGRPKSATAWLSGARGLAVLAEHIGYGNPPRDVFPSDRHYAQAYASFKLAGIAASARELKEAEKHYKAAVALFRGQAAGILGPSPGTPGHPNNELFGTPAKQLAGMSELNLGTVFRDAGDIDSAVKSFEASVFSLADSDDLPHVAMAHLNLGDVLLIQGSTERALSELIAAKAFYEKLKDESGIAQCQLNLGNLYVRTGEHSLALTAFGAAKKAFEATDDFLNLITVLQNEGVVHLNQGRFNEACACFEQARDLSAKEKDPLGLARATMNLGAAKFTMQRPLEAIVCFESARQIAKGSGDEFTAASCLSNLGTCYQELGLTREAILSLEEALAILRSIGAPNELAVTQSSIGMALARDGRREAAIKLHNQAAAMFTELKAPREIGVCQLNIAQLYFDLGNAQKAQDHISLAQSALAGTQAEPEVARLSLLSAQLAGASGDAKAATQQMDTALAAFESLNMPLDFVKGSICLGDHYARLGEPKLSSEIYARGLQKLAEVQAAQSDPLSTIISDMGSSLLTNYLGSAKDQLKNEDAFAMCQKTKGGLLRAALLEPSSLDMALNDSDGKRMKELRNDHDRVQKELRSKPNDNQLKDESNKTLSSFTAFDLYLRTKYPKFRALQASPASLAEVCKALGPRAALIEFVSGDQATYAFAVRQVAGRPSVRIARLTDSPNAIQHLIREFSIQLKRTPSNLQTLRQLGKRLYSSLLRPVEGSLKGVDTLIVCPDRMLHDVPFGALVQADGRYFIETCSLTTSPSSSAWLACRVVGDARQREKLEPPLVVGISKFGSQAGPPSSTVPQAFRSGDKPGSLPAAAEEAKIVAQILGCEPVLEGKATPDMVRRRLGSAKILHFATHAVANGTAPLMGYMMLAPQGKDDLGLLYAREVYGMHTSARLAVLSACETLGTKPTGEGIVGLSWAFLIAGCPSTIATRWQVEDESARIWVKAFYTSYVKGLSTAESAREACLALIGTKGKKLDRSSPSFWAAWALVGDDR